MLNEEILKRLNSLQCNGVHTSVKEIITCADCCEVLGWMHYEDAAKKLGAVGGKKSAESRLGGKTKEERSELMRKLRYSKKDTETITEVMEPAALEAIKTAKL